MTRMTAAVMVAVTVTALTVAGALCLRPPLELAHAASQAFSARVVLDGAPESAILASVVVENGTIALYNNGNLVKRSPKSGYLSVSGLSMRTSPQGVLRQGWAGTPYFRHRAYALK